MFSAIAGGCLRRATQRAARCTCALLAAGFFAELTAADLEIAPLRIDFVSERRTATITVRNTSDRPTSLQIEVVAWSQLDGLDIYTASRELLVSPPIVTIPASGQQIVRAALRRPAEATGELSYRINFKALPVAPTPGFSGVPAALRISLPVFVQPSSGPAVAKMIWRVEQMPDRPIRVVLNNQGNAHVQVTDFALYLPGTDQAIASEIRSTYALAGQTREWLLKSTALKTITDGRVQLKAYTDAGDIDTELDLGRP